jgi:hypothetical protein
MKRGYDILTVQETYGCGVVITKRIDPVAWGAENVHCIYNFIALFLG